MLYGFNAHVGAVENGLEPATLCVAEAASSTASGGCEARGGERGCLACSWDHGELVRAGCGRGAAGTCVPGAALWGGLGMAQWHWARGIPGGPRLALASGGDSGRR